MPTVLTSYFEPPANATETPPVNANTSTLGYKLFRHYRNRPCGRNVYIFSDGTVSEDDPDGYSTLWTESARTSDTLTAAPHVTHTFWGGHVGEFITTAQATLLIAAGYTVVQTFGFQPSDVASLVGWYDASDATTLTSSSGAVSQWRGVSGYGPNLDQATGAKQPATGTRTINSLNALDFDGSDDYIFGSSNPSGATPTIFVVLKSDYTGTNNRQFVGNDFLTQPVFYINAGFWRIYQGLELSSATAVDAVAHQLTAKFDSGTGTIWLDGSSIATGSTGTSVGGSHLSLGADATGAGASFWDGLIAEVIIYNTIISDANRLQVEAYLKAKWGTP